MTASGTAYKDNASMDRSTDMWATKFERAGDDGKRRRAWRTVSRESGIDESTCFISIRSGGDFNSVWGISADIIVALLGLTRATAPPKRASRHLMAVRLELSAAPWTEANHGKHRWF